MSFKLGLSGWLRPDQDASHRRNNFDTLRLLAAVGVVVSHSIPLTYGPKIVEALWRFSRHQATLGSIALQIFFIISGYLIAGSYLQGADARRFIRARFLRLAPALLVVLWLLAFVAGPVLSSLPLSEYFHSWLPYRAAFGLSDHLPGVFTHNPFSSGINGSLWTLRYEALCYFAVLGLGVLGYLRLAPVSVGFVLLLAIRWHTGSYPIPEFGALFAAGVLLRLRRPVLDARLALICVVVWLLSLRFGGYFLISDIFGAYLVIYLGEAIRLPNFARYGDFSYGVYIYAWPVQQTIARALHVGWVGNIAVTLPVVFVLAVGSWHFLESPALQLKNQRLFGIL